MQIRSQILKPRTAGSLIVINKCQNLAAGFCNTRVPSVRDALFRLENIPYSFRVLALQFLDHLPRIVARIVINYQDFPLERLRKFPQGNALYSLAQTERAVVGTNDHRNLSLIIHELELSWPLNTNLTGISCYVSRFQRLWGVGVRHKSCFQDTEITFPQLADNYQQSAIED